MVFKLIKSIFLKTRTYLGDKIKNIFSKPVSDETLDQLEEALYTADLGSKMSQEIASNIRKNFRQGSNSEEILEYIKTHLKEHLSTFSEEITLNQKLTVITVVGVNGNGKTTSTAKLANLFKEQGKKVLLAAADTFRAAAIEQLEAWSERIGIDVIKSQIGSDPAAVAFDALSAAISREVDVLIIDTAGRLQTKTDLMEELEKIHRVLKKQLDTAPHETLLVVDATIGQNAIDQAHVFNKHTPLTGLILTKLDGTAKGGMVVPIQDELKIPVKFIGSGEGIEDLRPFDHKQFVEELFH